MCGPLKIMVVLLATLTSLLPGVVGDTCSSNNCVRNWNRCFGYTLTKKGRWREIRRNCCNEDHYCVQQSRTHAECVPKKRGIPDGWDGDVLTCSTLSHCQHSRQVG